MARLEVGRTETRSYKTQHRCRLQPSVQTAAIAFLTSRPGSCSGRVHSMDKADRVSQKFGSGDAEKSAEFRSEKTCCVTVQLFQSRQGDAYPESQTRHELLAGSL
ncbi:hypothetical protein Bbelb_245120 [Branchiostoma belcheri]|nr:hypothetical protein Bbelb_245120 [Branchiostoma belcheri]